MIGPRYLDFGAIGSVIGHEITHGLSDLGAHTDLNGDKVDCIITQYENYTEPSTRLKVCPHRNKYNLKIH